MSNPTEAFLGEIRLFAFPKPPTGWLPCDGRLINISEQSALFSLLGTYYGGDGYRTFALPDLRGRVPLHQGTGPNLPNYAIGSADGAEDVTLITAQLPAHSHALESTVNLATGSTPDSRVHFATNNPTTQHLYGPPSEAAPYVVMAQDALSGTGGSEQHGNMMPSLVGNYCICTDGIYPQRAI